MRTTVSSIISDDEVMSWTVENIIIITAGTGSGKSYFIKNRLYKIAEQDNKQILMLIHRVNCLEQFDAEIREDGKSHRIQLMTYQHIESKLLSGQTLDFESYDYIVCDEFHYFISDASFNHKTDVSFSYIISMPDCVKIFMSATSENIKTYIEKFSDIGTIDYCLQPDYSQIKALTFFSKDETMEEFIKEGIEKGHKGIFFIQSVQKAFSLYVKYKEHSIFNCSKSNTYYRYVDTLAIQNMLQNEKFDSQFLITTSCLDSGVNLVDPELFQMVIDIPDIDTLLQCIGRKRFVCDSDQLRVYIKTLNNNQLGGLLTRTKREVAMAHYLKDNGLEAFMRKYPREIDSSRIIYDELDSTESKCTKKVNELMLYKKTIDIDIYKAMLDEGAFSYGKKIAKLLGFYDSETGYSYRTINEDYDLMRYLSSNEGRVYPTVESRKSIISEINLRRNGRLLRSLTLLNNYLLDKRLPFEILQKEIWIEEEGTRKRCRSAWQLLKRDG